MELLQRRLFVSVWAAWISDLTGEPLKGSGTVVMAVLLWQGGAAGAAGGPLDHLRNDARFQTLRQMVAQNPQILQPMLHELGKNNPDLLQQITDNQQDFLRLLTEEPPQVAEAAEGLMRLAGQGGTVTDTLLPERRPGLLVNSKLDTTMGQSANCHVLPFFVFAILPFCLLFL